MEKQRLDAIGYIRGLAMLGVIGIHVGAEYLMNPNANMHLVAVYEIMSRFSVPIFFFVSAFGLFYGFSFDRPFNYVDFLKRRGKAVFVPYFTWTVLYIIFNIVVWNVGLSGPLSFLATLFFGTAKYHLYFLVMLIWFYLLMPLWIAILKRLTPAGLVILLVLQICFNNYVSGDMLGTLTGQFSSRLFRLLIEYRLNYWIVYYVFVFLLGGWLAINSDRFFIFIRERFQLLAVSFIISLGCLCGYFYKLVLIDHYKCEWAVNTAQQLSPPGVIYSVTASLFFFSLFSRPGLPAGLKKVLGILSKHSYFVYLFHPVVLTFAVKLINRLGLINTAPVSIAMYLSVLLFSLLAAIFVRWLGHCCPLINQLTIGISPQK